MKTKRKYKKPENFQEIKKSIEEEARSYAEMILKFSEKKGMKVIPFDLALKILHEASTEFFSTQSKKTSKMVETDIHIHIPKEANITLSELQEIEDFISTIVGRH